MDFISTNGEINFRNHSLLAKQAVSERVVRITVAKYTEAFQETLSSCGRHDAFFPRARNGNLLIKRL